MSTPIAKMVREMIAKGVDPDIIELAVTTAELTAVPMSGGIPVDIAAEKRRAYDRDRKKRIRGIPPESTGHPRNSENASLSIESKKEEDTKKEVEGTQGRVRGHRLPDDWAPTPQDAVVADELVGPERRRAELEKFRDHWKQQPGSKGVKLDWDAAWRNWIRRSAEFGGNRNGQRPSAAHGKPAGGSFFDGLRSLAADIAGESAASGDAGPEIPRGRVEIDG